ncbi:MAG: MoxR family ATPase [Planctomycetota bacterium]|nr:MAG: MoxR family ATPase [Planctomycetota bacterium]
MTSMEEKAKFFREKFQQIEKEMSKVIVGHKEILRNVLITFCARGNALLEGVPGLGKTLLVRALAQVMNVKFSRIQFTPDLMPADIIGTQMVVEDEEGNKVFKFEKGPIFANIVLADEINRATPKTQSALLEAMQEHGVTVGGVRNALEEPFFVLATQNPLEMEGTYPLPEAQLDRFFFKLNVSFPSIEELERIAALTTTNETPTVEKVATGEDICQMQEILRSVIVAEHVQKYGAKIVLATHPGSPYMTDKVKKYIKYGSSPRGLQAIILGAKALALLDGRMHVSTDDIREVVPPALRHRLIRNFEGEAEGISVDEVLKEILEKVSEEPEKKSA